MKKKLVRKKTIFKLDANKPKFIKNICNPSTKTKNPISYHEFGWSTTTLPWFTLILIAIHPLYFQLWIRPI
jgi:hypothetical protein